MKTLLLIISLLTATQIFAEEGEKEMFSAMGVTMVSLSPLVTIASPLTIASQISKMSGMNSKVAKLIVNDAQDYIQNGNMNVYLASKVNLIQQKIPEMSSDEAVDLLLAMAEQYL